MSGEVRLLDLGFVPALRSQTIYHAVAESVSKGAQDTISILSPGEPYVCIGMHQELEKEVDLGYCNKHKLPVYRRRIGGGAVYLDKNQLFYHIMFHKDNAPRDVNEVYSRFLKAPVETYRAIGINAFHRPINDLQVDGRKIGGTGAATMGDCLVVVGSLILDFDYETMTNVLKVPDEKFRDKIFKTMNEYLTTVKREVGYIPPRDKLKDLLVGNFEKTLGIKLVKGDLTAREHETIEKFDNKFVSDEWLHRVSHTHPDLRKVKISEGVNIIEGSYKAEGGLIRTTTTVEGSIVKDVLISGDFFIYPDVLDDIQEVLVGASLGGDNLLGMVESVYAEKNVQSPGITPEDIVYTLMKQA